MEQNIQECNEAIKKIEKKLTQSGYNIILNKNNILCKTPKAFINTLSTSTCPSYKNGKCVTTNTCDRADCPLHNNSNNQTITSYSKNDCLFRIMPSDLNTSISLHVIILHGETCELKMSFDYDNDGVQKIVDVINFLVY